MQITNDFKPCSYKVGPVRHHSFCGPPLVVDVVGRCRRKRIQTFGERRSEHVRQQIGLTTSASAAAAGLTPAAAAAAAAVRRAERVEERVGRQPAARRVTGGEVDGRRDVLAVGDERREGGETAARRRAVRARRVAAVVVVAARRRRRLVVVPVAVVVVYDVVDGLLVEPEVVEKLEVVLEPEVVADVRAQGPTPSCVVGGGGARRRTRPGRRHGVDVRLAEVATALVADDPDQ